MSQPPAKKPTAAAVGAKTARACDSCLLRRARWYCAADDAFLCQPCDNSVHSANPLARRHERVRLKTASSSSAAAAAPSFKPLAFDGGECETEPAWHHECKRKARTPRSKCPAGLFGRADTVVPDLDLASLEDFNAMDVEEEEQLLYRVPILDPVLADLCSPPVSSDEAKPDLPPVHDLAGFLITSDMDMTDFDLDVESLLGRGLDGEDAFYLEELGSTEPCQHPIPSVKIEQVPEADGQLDGLPLDTIDVKFACRTPKEEKPAVDGERRKKKRTRIMLDLNIEGVISAWDNKPSPWIDGARPQFDLDDWSLDFMWRVGVADDGRATMIGGGHGARDGGREARVSRYREKRRTRLFSKKIRYEVRKLNAEKRPRMKGRFVKRTSLFSSNAGIGGGGGQGITTVAQPQYVML